MPTVVNGALNTMSLKPKLWFLEKVRNQDNRREWFLGPCPISQVDSYKHLGIVLQTRGSHCDKIDEACRRGKGSFMSLIGVGVRPNELNPLTSSNLLKLIVYPRSLYGCELWNHSTESQLLQLERMQRFCIKLIQGFPKRTRSDKATCICFNQWRKVEVLCQIYSIWLNYTTSLS